MPDLSFPEPAAGGRRVHGPVLVTGATGFLGRHLVGALLDGGSAVRALGRNLQIGLELSAWGADFRPVDLRDRPGIIAACRGMRAAVHAGALSSAWGDRRDFYDINVRGTEHVLEGCRLGGVERLVYISSPSVLSRHETQLGLDESAAFPDEFVSVYSETKALAEKRVREAFARGLKAVILRPKAIYGPGDQALFPRLLEALSKGRLPILGDGSAVTDLTHVEDAVQAILLALESDKAVGNAYLITGGEPVNLLDIARILIDRLGCPPLRRTIPVNRAMLAGRVLEEVWKRLHLKGEPPLTRYKISVMAYSQTYDIAAAKRDLGYVPRVPWREGVERFLKSLAGEASVQVSNSEDEPAPGGLSALWPHGARGYPRSVGESASDQLVAGAARTEGAGAPRSTAFSPTPGGILAGAVEAGRDRADVGIGVPPALGGIASGTIPTPQAAAEPVRVRLTLLTAGSTEARERMFGLSRSLKKVTIPALFGLVEHPVHGPGLFDTGYSTHLREATRKLPERLYALALPVRISPEQDAAAQIERRGVERGKVPWVIVSHFDPDHIGGLKDFPNARVVCSWRAWAGIAGKRGLKALAARLLPGLLPADMAGRLLILPDPAGPAIGPFAHSLDLFGDSSVRLVHLPGHAPGMLGAFLSLESGRTRFLCADGCWSLNAIETGNIRLGMHRRIAVNKAEQDDTYRRLMRLRAEMPEVEIVPSHCPWAASRYPAG